MRARNEEVARQGWWLGAEDEDLERLDRVLDEISEENRTPPS